MEERLLGKKKEQTEVGERRIPLWSNNDGSKEFSDNSIKTSKYSFIPLHPSFFVWKNLLEQLGRYANLYFLTVSCLQLIPGLSPTGRFTTLVPLTFVLTMTMIKDTYEDYKRHVRDRGLNGQNIQVYRNNSWETKHWDQVKVGDVVEVRKTESKGEFPADLLLLWSTENQGLCHIETANLDGETNLKVQKTHIDHESLPEYNTDNPSQYQGEIICQAPNKSLYTFEGKMVRGSRPEETSAISVKSILLRGAKLGGSTERIQALVIYTGKQSKLMMNQQESRHKRSTLEEMTNTQIIFMLVLQMVLCGGSALGLGVAMSDITNHWYLAAEGSNPVTAAFAGFGTFLILFNNLIPISLYVSMEVVKIVQAKLMSSDLEIYHEESNTPTDAKTSSLNEELGQVQYIFSDKTGTLTCNIMDFLKFSVGEVAYGTGTTEIGRAAAIREGRVLNDDKPAGIKLVKGFYFYDQRISDVAGEGRDWNWLSQPNAKELGDFFRLLAVCHTVTSEQGKDDDGNPCTLYQASSPDEACLVTGVKYLGVEYVTRDATDITITIAAGGGTSYEEKWKLLEVFEFSSDRKRMSVIVRDPTGQLRLFCKGADTVIFERLRKPESDAELQMRNTTLENLRTFAAEGLRTLCIAETDISEKQYQEWAPTYKAATEAVGGKEEKEAAAQALIEKDLKLIGSTAIEDKLQEGVPASIEMLRACGINVWVLTGDKQETAINIGFACALLHNDMGLFEFDEGATAERITEQLQDFARQAANIQPGKDQGVIVQGAALTHITSETAPPTNSELFLEVTKKCKAVICCRVSPAQKAEVVRLVKTGLKTVTLSIGDGANDVAMITEAHVGIGISGLEGLQAARASDYSIGQFRFLLRLLLVHGRWSYRRVTKVILYSFYKNILLYLTQFCFCFFNNFTGQSFYDRWALSLFNVVFAFFPIVAVGIFDRDIEPHRLMTLDQFPELYDEGRKGTLFTTKVFWQFSVTAMFQSATCFFIPVAVLHDAVEDQEGYSIGLSWSGITAYTGVIWVVTLKCALETRYDE